MWSWQNGLNFRLVISDLIPLSCNLKPHTNITERQVNTKQISKLIANQMKPSLNSCVVNKYTYLVAVTTQCSVDTYISTHRHIYFDRIVLRWTRVSMADFTWSLLIWSWCESHFPFSFNVKCMTFIITSWTAYKELHSTLSMAMASSPGQRRNVLSLHAQLPRELAGLTFTLPSHHTAS